MEWGKEETLFNTRKISLWPSLFIDDAGRHLLVWYEYNSKYYPGPSDIYYSLSTREGKFRRKTKITHYPSYDNGPCIYKDFKGGIFAAWHSWRPPGRGPFIDDSAENIWMKEFSLKKEWSKARMLFPSIEKTSYPSIIQTNDGQYIMALTIEGSGILVSRSKNAVIWTKPAFSPYESHHYQRADIIQDKNGIYWLFFECMKLETSVIKYSFSKDLHEWSEPRTVNLTERAQRPKVSVDLRGRFWLSWYAGHWGGTEFTSVIVHKSSVMEIEIESDGTGGNSCWALNHLKIEGNKSKKIFDFGSDGINSSIALKVTSKTKLYSKRTGFGFDRKVGDMVRTLGTGFMSDLVYARGKRSFKVELSPGKYTVILNFSSWIASTKKIKVKINGSVVIDTFDTKDYDRVYCQFSDNGQEWSGPILVSDEEADGDRNRPSKIIEQRNVGHWIAYTSFQHSGVNIVRKLMQSIN